MLEQPLLKKFHAVFLTLCGLITKKKILLLCFYLIVLKNHFSGIARGRDQIIQQTKQKTIVIHSMGTLGDLFPFLTIAKSLHSIGHQVIYATQKEHQDLIEKAGIRFYPVRPEFYTNDPAFASHVFNFQETTDYIFNQLLFPHLEETYTDLMIACENADVLISGSFALCARLVAEKKQIQWISLNLQPFAYLSRLDPPLTFGFSWLPSVWPLFSFLAPWISWAHRKQLLKLSQPYYTFRKKIDLPDKSHQIEQDYHSDQLDLALFSSTFTAKQKDWPIATKTTGFILDDNPANLEWIPSVSFKKFIQQGNAPIVFTLGSGAAYAAKNFYQYAIEALRQLDQRAIFIIGKQIKLEIPEKLKSKIFTLRYAPYSHIFPYASMIVHQGGIGTTAQALSAAKPMVIIPFAGDQFDNAYRIFRLGVGHYIHLNYLTAHKLKEKILAIFANDRMKEKASQISLKLKEEDGVSNALGEILNYIH